MVNAVRYNSLHDMLCKTPYVVTLTKKIATEKTREKLLPKTSDRKDVREVLLSQGFFDKGTKLMF